MVDGYVTQKRYQGSKIPGVFSVLPDGSSPPISQRARFHLPNGTPVYPAPFDFRRYQETTSFRTGVSVSDKENHFLQYESLLDRGLTAVDNGHTFDTMTRFATTSVSNIEKNFSNGSGFRGSLRWSDTSSAALPPLPGFDLNWYGNKAIAATAPNAPRANTLQTAAELLREGITSPLKATVDLIQGRTNNVIKTYGDEYLNLEFGWKPLVSDFEAVLKVVQDHSKMMLQLKRDSGRFVRRRWGFPIALTNSSEKRKARVTMGGAILDGSALQPLWRTPLDNSGFEVTRTIQTSQSVWFSGAFTYYLNLGSTLQDKFEFYGKQADYLLGLKITPEVMWELTPWSWLTDYFVDVGSAIKAARLLDSDSLVLKYGYMMRKTSRRVTSTGRTGQFYDGSDVTMTSSYVENRKQRFRSTPFGFGLNPSGFSTRQWAVLGALGMTKAPNKLF